MRRYHNFITIPLLSSIITLSGCGIDGSGSADKVAKFTGATSIGDSNITSLAGDKVGINISSPSEALHVNGNVLIEPSANSAQTLRVTNTAGHRLIQLDTTDSILHLGAETNLIQPFAGESDSALLARTANGFDLLRIRTNDRYVRVGPGENGDAKFWVVSNSPHAATVDALGGGTVLKVDAANSRVGIGTATPSNILTVAQNSATDPIADSWLQYSSIRWKKDVSLIEDALQKVQAIRGVSFTWKETDRQDVGLIAEEVGEVIPEIVEFEGESNRSRSIDYGRLTAVLVEAIKAQQNQIDALRKRIDTLRDPE